jgi:energy-coupling factor transport system permease protein
VSGLERRGISPLHAARAPVAAAYAIALVSAVLLFEHPVPLVALGIAIIGAGVLAGAGRSLLRGALFGVPFALAIALINPLVVREGLTVVVRFGEVGPFGQLDITREALVFGAILGLRALFVMLAGGALVAATVDADEVLHRFRRISARSALTAALAVRLVPVLGRDARRLDEALRCRPDASDRPRAAQRLQIVRAVATGALDRALDVAATLEVRGYATPGAARGARRVREPWSRHDIAFLASAVGLVALSVGARLTGLAAFQAYPLTHASVGPEQIGLGLVLVVVALLPFADRRGIER